MWLHKEVTGWLPENLITPQTDRQTKERTNAKRIFHGVMDRESWVWVYWCFKSHATILQSYMYMWRHRCAGWLKKKLYLWSGSQRHRHFAGFFNVPVPHRHGTTLFIRWFRHTAPFSRLSRHAGDTKDIFPT